MTGPIRSLVPLADVRDMRVSIAFYEKLGFTVSNSVTADGEDEPNWCWLSSEKAGLMLAKRSEWSAGEHHAVLFYTYCDDVEATHALFADRGVEVGPINRPFYNPGGEFEICDPNGYRILVAQI
jgi:predicted enzyme related to lactoylglutathione lyase